MPSAPLTYPAADRTRKAREAAAAPDLSVVIVNYNVRPFLEQALHSVQRACQELSAEIFVVDNNSVDGSVEMVKERFPEVQLLANEENCGFAHANNQAIRHARGRYILILNPDTLVQEDTAAVLIWFMDAHPEAGAVGCQILNPDGTFAPESRRTFPSPDVAFYRITGLSRLFPRSKVFGKYNLSYAPVDEVMEVDALSGSCMLVRRAALVHAMTHPSVKVDTNGTTDPLEGVPLEELDTTVTGAGLLDESFFMYGEDLDWCYRFQQAGWKIYYTPDTRIIHYKGESTKQGEMRYVRLFYGAMLQFADKHFHGRYSALFAAVLRVGIVLRAGVGMMAATVRKLTLPAFEWLLTVGVIAAAGAVSAQNAGIEFGWIFYGILVPSYALLTVLSIGASGGYGRSASSVRPVFSGVGAAFVAVSVISFFIRRIAYSRAAVLLGFVGTVVVLLFERLVRRNRSIGKRQAVLVGQPSGAQRLRRMLAGRPNPSFELAGYVPPDEAENPLPADRNGIPKMGTLRQLREVVRINRIDDVVFAAGDMSNFTMFKLMKMLQDLPVSFRVLTENADHIIGKASIEDLSTPMLVGAEAALGPSRLPFSRRAFDLGVGAVLIACLPIVWVIGKLGGKRRLATWNHAGKLIARIPRALIRGSSLVGYATDTRLRPPADWGLHPGVFPIVGDEARALLTDKELTDAYWLYAQNQSAALDMSIIFRRLQRVA